MGAEIYSSKARFEEFLDGETDGDRDGETERDIQRYRGSTGRFRKSITARRTFHARARDEAHELLLEAHNVQWTSKGVADFLPRQLPGGY